MLQEAGTVILAGVAHIPKHDPGWGGTFQLLLGFFVGCPITVAGVYLTVGLWRVKDGKTWFNHLFGPLVFVIGLAVAVPCFGFAFHLL
ncbi:hypothetical protein ACH4VR_35445 [Streptomyces sp. NPDC020883]|uniref:hypothetical protein n=1 Tax=unclassified Streptomyces TaxID=2593676 RepID=UPI0034E2BBA4